MCLCDRLRNVICAYHQHERDKLYPVQQPATWDVPEQPGPHVEAVRDRNGRRWVRESKGDSSVWVLHLDGQTFGYQFWRALLLENAPLTDDTEVVSDGH